MRPLATHLIAASLGFWAAIALWRAADRALNAPPIGRLHN